MTTEGEKQSASPEYPPADHYQEALQSLHDVLEKIHECTAPEKKELIEDLQQLQQMVDKMESGRVEIVVFGEISTGKSSLINALLGETVAEVDVRGGWTKETHGWNWNQCVYRLPGVACSEVVLVDTPGINEVAGEKHAAMARESSQRADIVLFVVDSDINDKEFNTLREIVADHKHVVVVFNKIDQYKMEDRKKLAHILQDRVARLFRSIDIVPTSADPMEREYIIEKPDGTEVREIRKPPVQVADLKVKILEILEKEGKALLALNASMYASDKSDKVAAIRIQLRDDKANRIIWSFASFKAIAVGANPVPVADILAGSALDVSMVIALSHIYGINFSKEHASTLLQSIGVSLGGMIAITTLLSIASSAFKGITAGLGTLFVAVPQGAVGGFCAYIVGQAAKKYFENGASWGPDGPKKVVADILNTTDQATIMGRLRLEILNAIQRNKHEKSPHLSGKE